MKAKILALIASSVLLANCGQGASTTTSAASTTASATTETASSTTTVGAPQLKVGDCVHTTVASVGTRLEAPDAHGVMTPMPGSGSAISFANGINQVSYDAVPGIDHSRAGDAVDVCLVSLPHNCPPGDDRGKEYRSTNARTHESWSTPDSEHMCGGA